MLSIIEKKLFRSKEFVITRQLLLEKGSVAIAGLSGSALGFLAKHLFENGFSKLVIITPEMQRADQIWNDLSNLLDDERVYFFPSRKAERDYTNKIDTEIIGLQLKSLSLMIEKQPGIFVLPVRTLTEPIPDLNNIRKKQLHLSVGSEIQIGEISEKLVSYGYERTDLVSGVGEFCIRGGLIDVFPFESLKPLRLEFFGDSIETIRTFDVISQRSEKKQKQFKILSPSVKNSLINKKGTKTLFDLFSSDTLLLLDEPEQFERSLNTQSVQLNSEFDLYENFIDRDENKSSSHWTLIKKKFDQFNSVAHHRLGHFQQADVHFKMVSNEDFRGNIKQLREKIKLFTEEHAHNNPEILILLEEKYEIERLLDLLEEKDNNYHIKVCQGTLHSGFISQSAGIMVVTEKDLYDRFPRKKNLGKYRGGIPISKLNALSRGDLRVHVDHGIGRYMGLDKM